METACVEPRPDSRNGTTEMDGYDSLIDALEVSITHKDISHRAEVLRRVTDLFVDNAARLSSDKLALFDDVVVRLLREVEAGARAAFGQRITELGVAPRGIVRALALDDLIEVAGPALSRLDDVEDGTLIETAQAKSQDHLLAIAQRRSVSEAVTDVLVDRGDHRVAISVAENPGSRFSSSGFVRLVSRSETDAELGTRLWLRPEIPCEHLVVLFDAASEVVRAKLQALDPAKADDIRDMVGLAREALQTNAREASADFRAKTAAVRLLHETGRLSEADLAAYARARKLDETSVALSLLCDVPTGIVARAMTHRACDHVLVLAKSIALSWGTVREVLALRPGAPLAPEDVEHVSARFARLRQETARRAVEYYRLRERTVGGETK